MSSRGSHDPPNLRKINRDPIREALIFLNKQEAAAAQRGLPAVRGPSSAYSLYAPIVRYAKAGGRALGSLGTAYSVYKEGKSLYDQFKMTSKYKDKAMLPDENPEFVVSNIKMQLKAEDYGKRPPSNNINAPAYLVPPDQNIEQNYRKPKKNTIYGRYTPTYMQSNWRKPKTKWFSSQK